ncbi:Centrosomal protein of 120 kDa [Fasciola hepatica]|uniref:Centrosomal protein of 120 kDa n=1 Tax=Fasciola hepatica TaxID=6192 RepID=A0A4E0RN20_FASHE|nr:Centrosomal protein of 120 kDa [Fasciola hepatica]
MILKGRHLVVIAVISGRNFPDRPDHHLTCEARFNNEVLTTDPMPHKPEPKFEQELAWELDKASLRQHRLQRSALKVQLFAVDNRSPVKEPIGYFMLDLRSCSENKDYRWYRLLHSRYKNNPAVFCGLYLDSDGQDFTSDSKVKTGLALSLSAKDLIPRSSTPTPRGAEDEGLSSVEPKLIPVCYAIGPKCLAKERFQLTVRFHAVTGLSSLIPLERELSTVGLAGFYLTCDLLGSTYSSKRFDNLAHHSFHADEHTVHVKSTVSILRAYFAQSTPLTVNLCYGSRSLAHALVPIDKLVRSNDRLLSEPALLEGKYELRPLEPDEDTTGDLLLPHEDDRPFVVLSLALSRSELSNGFATPDTVVTSRRSATPPRESIRFNLPECQSPVGSIPTPQPTPVQPVSGSGYRVDSDDTSDMDQADNLIEQVLAKKEMTPIQDVLMEPDTPSLPPDTEVLRPETTLTSTLPRPSTPKGDELHRFCYTIELRTLKNFLSLDHEPLVYARYVYPLFGSAAPVMTLPPIRIGRYQEVTLSKGFCVFEFAASISELRERLMAAPLVVELFDRSQGPKGMDEILGRATIQLATIFNCAQHEATDGKSTVRRFSGVADFVPAKSCAELTSHSPGALGTQFVGQLTYNLTLEDHGLHTTDQLPQTTSRESLKTDFQHRRATSSPPDQTGSTHRSTDIRATAEYRTALDLELWRAAEEAKFMARLKEREKRLMTTLAEEWHKRDSQRELICRKKVSEYQQLEEKLRSTLAELTERERQIASNETELVQLRQQTEHQAELRKTELEQMTRIQIRDMECKLKLEAKQTEYWRMQTDEWKNKYIMLERELTSIRSHLTQAEIRRTMEGRPATAQEANASVSTTVHGSQMELAKALAELATVRGTLAETERRLDEAQRGRQRYRQLWTRTLHEVARLKQDAELTARQSLARREAELEQLRLRYLGMGEKESNTQQSRETGNEDPLKAIREQLERFAEQTGNPLGPEPETRIKMVAPSMTSSDPELVRLIEERDGLLSTGVYEPDDPIITNLERQIRLLLDQT